MVLRLVATHIQETNMDLLDKVLNALDIKVSPEFSDIAKNMPPVEPAKQGDETNGNTK